MELNGRILKNINISGVITDQNFPLQERKYSEFKDFDNVFLKVQHPNVELDAGDIDFTYSDKFTTVNRKLEGLKNQFQFKKWSAHQFMQTLKENFILFKSKEGTVIRALTISWENGNRDIAILSGTEQVWVNGKKLYVVKIMITR